MLFFKIRTQFLFFLFLHSFFFIIINFIIVSPFFYDFFFALFLKLYSFFLQIFFLEPVVLSNLRNLVFLDLVANEVSFYFSPSFDIEVFKNVQLFFPIFLVSFLQEFCIFFDLVFNIFLEYFVYNIEIIIIYLFFGFWISLGCFCCVAWLFRYIPEMYRFYHGEDFCRKTRTWLRKHEDNVYEDVIMNHWMPFYKRVRNGIFVFIIIPTLIACIVGSFLGIFSFLLFLFFFCFFADMIIHSFFYIGLFLFFFFLYIIESFFAFFKIVFNFFLFLDFFFLSKSNLIFSNFNFVYLDGLSLVLVWLTSLMGLLCCLYIYNVVGFSFLKHQVLILVIVILLISCFLVKNLLFFYILFEAILIPLFLLIGLGSRGRKMHANYLFFFYTFLSSLPLILGIVYIYVLLHCLNFDFFYFVQLSNKQQSLIFWLFFIGFAAKIPLLPLHVWLPEAHVEAPTVGSVILAAILLKLGAYGLYRVIFPLCNLFTMQSLSYVCIPYVVISIILPACIAVRQVDLKKIVAYSSVVHMSFSLLGLFSQTQLGIQGFLFSLISHGLISSGMFFSVGMLYDRFHIRNLLYFGGLVQFMPIFSIFFFFILFSNMSFPGTVNFVGEFFILVSILKTFGFLTFLFISFGLFATVLFCLLLLGRVLFYQISNLFVCNLSDLTFIEFLILFFLCIYILFFGICPLSLLSFF